MSSTLTTMNIIDIKGNFNIPSYQRGYRWNTDNVIRLLNDINNIKDNSDDKYCLQPVVVTEENGRYNIIDGQQRLTTLYLILKYIKEEANPNIEICFSLYRDTNKEYSKYIETLDGTMKNSNPDYYHLSCAYEAIKKWFIDQFADKNKRIKAAKQFINKFTQKINIIWYIVKTSNPEQVFIRLNIGKIRLTNAELVKALLISHMDNESDQIKLISQWDLIEQELSDKEFWGFLNPNKEYTTKIELLFDVIQDKKDDSKDDYYSFYKYDTEINDGNVNEVWSKVNFYFQLLKSFYHNRTLYHKVGYLRAIKASDISSMIKLTKSNTKKEFESKLDETIKKLFEKINIDNLSYGKQQEKKHMKNLLLLFNVLLGLDNKNIEKFPFHLYRANMWGLEHIHAQNAKDLSTKEEWLSWLEDHENIIKLIENKNDEFKDILRDINNIKSEITFDKFSDISDKIIKCLSREDSASLLNIDGIGNMALVSNTSNSILSNRVFAVKRRKIIEIEEGKDKEYIPIGTKKVFFKYYSDKDNIYFWTSDDQNSYIKKIYDVVGKYLPAQQDQVLIWKES